MNKNARQNIARITYYMGMIMALCGYYLHDTAHRYGWATGAEGAALLALVLIGPVAVFGTLSLFVLARNN